MEFLKEAAIMHSIEHENIVRLYGVVLDTESLMLVTELAHLRSLLECLKDSGLRVSFLTVPTLCEFAQQICSGMMYLENKRLIHRYVYRLIFTFTLDFVDIVYSVNGFNICLLCFYLCGTCNTVIWRHEIF